MTLTGCFRKLKGKFKSSLCIHAQGKDGFCFHNDVTNLYMQ